MLPGTGCRTAAGLLPGTLPALWTAQRLLGLFLGLADGIAVELVPVQGIQIIGKAAENLLVFSAMVGQLLSYVEIVSENRKIYSFSATRSLALRARGL